MVRLSPPRIYQGFIVLMVAIYLLSPATRILSFPVNLAGIPVFIAGAWLAISARRQFVARQTPVPFSATTNMLHKHGAYRYSRNPMYLGIAIGLLGIALLCASYINFLFPPLFVLVIDRFYVIKEEQALLRQFGDDYQEYRNNVRRWL
jgi:protein-S-isoprenylcysteine O-methyltransferase Ste14